jgi:hypothetical protein
MYAGTGKMTTSRGRKHFMRLLAQYLAFFSFAAPHGLVAVVSAQATVDETVLNTAPNPWTFDNFVNEGIPADTPLTSDIAGSTLREAFCPLPSSYNDTCDWCAASRLVVMRTRRNVPTALQTFDRHLVKMYHLWLLHSFEISQRH